MKPFIHFMYMGEKVCVFFFYCRCKWLLQSQILPQLMKRSTKTFRSLKGSVWISDEISGLWIKDAFVWLYCLSYIYCRSLFNCFLHQCMDCKTEINHIWPKFLALMLAKSPNLQCCHIKNVVSSHWTLMISRVRCLHLICDMFLISVFHNKVKEAKLDNDEVMQLNKASVTSPHNTEYRCFHK